ncbi:MAG: tetratricopeptide repeat protein, partial [Anaerolineae bacterium]
DTGDYTSARRLYEESRKIREEIGDRSGLAATLHNLGHLARQEGDLKQAAEHLRQSLRLVEELGVEEAFIKLGFRIRDSLAQVEREMGENR